MMEDDVVTIYKTRGNELDGATLIAYPLYSIEATKD
jgi:hypothetical protein